MHGRSKNQNVKIISNGDLSYMDKRITSLASEFKPDNILFPFGQKKEKMVKSGILPFFDTTVLWPKMGQILSYLNSWARFGIISSFYI